jgi:hypothetical protein
MNYSRASFALLVVLIGFCSCAPRPTAYKPMGTGEFGYSEMLLGDSTYRIVFAGNPQTSLEIVDRYTLYRAAELTLKNGGDYFVILSDKDDNNTTSYSGATSNADANVTHNAQPVGSVFTTTTTATATSSMSSYSGSYTQHSSIKNIQYFTGKRPSGNPNAYDARAMMTNMEAQLTTDKQRADTAVKGVNALYTVYYVISGIAFIALIVIMASSHHTTPSPF